MRRRDNTTHMELRKQSHCQHNLCDAREITSQVNDDNERNPTAQTKFPNILVYITGTAEDRGFNENSSFILMY